MRLVLFGAGGGTGRRVLDQALDAGHHVIAVVRRREVLAAYERHAQILEGDILQPQAWQDVLTGADAVISTVGIGTQRSPTTVYSEGARNVLAAMRPAGVRRLEVISAPLAEPRERWTRYGALRARVLFPILDQRLRASYDDMRRMERILGESDVDWTSYRPPYLTDRAPRGQARVAINAPLKRASTLARGDLAAIMLNGIRDPHHFRAIVEVSN